MDLELRCNIIKCRKIVCSKAYVTSCSRIAFILILDIFCPDCAAKSFNYALVCPTGENPLSDSKDIYYADLKPTEEWKSLVIAGQKPETISEICSRATSFWSYQMHQEHVYNDLLMKNLQEKWLTTERHYQNSIIHLKNEISSFSDRSAELKKQLEVQKRREAESMEQITEKNRQLKKMQLLCDKLRRKGNNGNQCESHYGIDFVNDNFIHNQMPSEPLVSIQPTSWLDKWPHSIQTPKENNEPKVEFSPKNATLQIPSISKNQSHRNRQKNSNI